MTDIETREAHAVLSALERIADGQHQQIAAQRDLSEVTKANTLSIQELTITIERQRGEVMTRFQHVEDRLDIVETKQGRAEIGQQETQKRIWAMCAGFITALFSATLAWATSHWPFHIPPSHGR